MDKNGYEYNMANNYDQPDDDFICEQCGEEATPAFGMRVCTVCAGYGELAGTDDE